MENKPLNKTQTELEKRNTALQKFGVGSALTGTALLASTSSFALDVASETAKSTAKDDIMTAALFVLGIVIVFFSAKIVIGFFRS